MTLYVKKPVVIEAKQFTDNAVEIIHWLHENDVTYMYGSTGGVIDLIEIGTLEGAMVARMGDYIIKGIQGEFYPCKPDIFDATYEEVRT